MPTAPSLGERAIVRVALPVPVDTLFDYVVPVELAREAEPGRRVLVPFRARRLVGVIVSEAGLRDPAGGETRGRLRPLERLLDPAPVLSAEMLRILCEAAHDTLCPVGLAFAAALPPAPAPRTRTRIRLTARGREALARRAVPESTRTLLEALSTHALSQAAAVRAAGAAARLRALEHDGLVTTERRDDLAPAPRSRRERWLAVAAGVDVAEARAGPLARAPKQAALLAWLAEHGAADLASVRAHFGGADALLRALARRGLVRSEERASPTPRRGLEEPAKSPPTLAPEQQVAFETVREALAARRFETFLLHGVTGSGKTEVYLRLVAEALERGRQALVLVPEITLTHQLVGRLHARFGERLAILHSGLRPGERLEEWERLRSGAFPIGVGARSALFAPLEDLGVIVVDEEHDPAYKNEEGFRYHARDLAARRASAAGCPLVLGSATPSLESRFAADRGTLHRLVLPHRIGGRPLPAVEIVDLERERAVLPRGRKLILSRVLKRALSETLREGGQTILFLNRRGFSTRIFCFECGHAERCKNCDISLVYHATEERLRCHYCDYGMEPPDVCSSCGADETALLGLGTERVEEELRIRFPEARIARLDRDTAARRGSVERVLRDLAGGRIDVLVGTQMVAKGHDFPGVRLVGVIAADLGLHFPDFRAAERTFQLLTQVAGRAGRGAAPGRVVVQTFVPDHYAIRPVRDHDFEAFYREELSHRAALAYPPFGRIVRALVSGVDAAEVEDAARALAETVRAKVPAQGEPPFEVLGPAPAPIPRLRGRFRQQLLVKGLETQAVLAAGRSLARAAERPKRGVRIQVDADPVHML